MDTQIFCLDTLLVKSYQKMVRVIQSLFRLNPTNWPSEVFAFINKTMHLSLMED